MNSENEKTQLETEAAEDTMVADINSEDMIAEDLPTENINSAAENSSDEVVEEKAKEKDDADAASEEFISEFAPAPINIPNYNKEKAMEKREKAKAKKKKKNSRKSKKRRRMLKKVVFALRTAVLFVLLLTVISATLSVLIVKINTSEYAVESAIRTHEPENFIVGKIKKPQKLNLKESSARASVADILRDNSMITVTYEDIKTAVAKSTYPDFVAKKAHEVIEYYLYAKPYNEITAIEISELLLENVSYIKLITGQELGQTACDAIGKYMIKSTALKEITEDSLAKQPLANYTHMTSVLLSMPALISLLAALLVLLVLTVVACREFFHKMIGWACMITGVFMCASVAAGKMFFGPLYKSASEFASCVVDAIGSSFETSMLIYGGLAFLLGLIVMLIGHAMTDGYDDEEIDENDYIDEIEQVTTAQ